MNEMILTIQKKKEVESSIIEASINLDNKTSQLNLSIPFISYEDLSIHFGVTQGNLNTTAQANKWLHFTLDGKELYVNKVAIRNNISWDYLYSKGLVYGTNDNGIYPTGTATNQYKTITLNGKVYKCRLLKGCDPGINQLSVYNGYDFVGTQQSEWSRIFYPIVTNDPNITSYNGPLLASYTENDLQMRRINDATTPGSYSWCQETWSGGLTYRAFRGSRGPSFLNWYTSSTVNQNVGWRACLELV